MLLTMGLSGMPSLCTLGSPYNVGGLEPAGHSCRRVSSVIDDFSAMPWFSVLLKLLDPW